MRLQLSPVRLTLKRPLRTARAELRVREGWLVALHASVGGREFVGRGEATPHPFAPASELAATERALCEAGASLAGVELPRDLAGVEALVDSIGALRSAPAARHAVECALLELLARVEGVPLAVLLGGRGEVATRVKVNALLVEDSPEALADEARRAVQAGFGTVKVKVGLGAELDAARLRAVREAVGPSMRLRIDANGGWSLDEARASLQRLREFGLELCEQPVAASELQAMRVLRAEAPCSIAADEAAVSEAAVRELFAEGVVRATDVLVVRPMVLGGLLPSLRAVQWARAQGADAYVASGLDGVHARAAAAHLAAAMGEGELAHGLAVGPLFECPEDAYAPSAGFITLPDAPGLGLPEGAENTALVFGDRRWSWTELDAEVEAWCARLRVLGVTAGSRFAVLSANRPEFVFLIHAAWRMGAVIVPLNARLSAAELAPLVAKARAVCVIAEEALAERVQGAVVLERIGEGADLEVEADAISDTQDAAWLFTSGTTGTPKAARLTRGNFIASAEASARNLGGGSEAPWLLCMPLFHVGGLAMVLRALLSRSTLVLHRRFDTDAVLQSLRMEKVAFLSVVPTQLRWLLDVAGDERAPSSLRAVLVGGGPSGPELLSRARAQGWPVLQTYGLTEACSQVTTERLGHTDTDGSTAGLPLDCTRVRISGEREILLQGPTLTPGYADAPEANADLFTADGWLRTGDLGELDERGRLRVLSRRVDLIISGGENVYPAEIEAVLATHPHVADCAVVPFADALWGEVPLALVTMRDAHSSPPEALTAWCRTRLAGFKVPRRFLAVKEVPRNATGKLDRASARALAERIAAEAASDGATHPHHLDRGSTHEQHA